MCWFVLLFVPRLAGSVDWVWRSVVSPVLASSMSSFRSCFITSVD